MVPVNLLWNPCVPTKVGFFAWEAWWGKFLTSDQPKKRRFSLASKCPFCEKVEEVMEHLFIHCPMIWSLWTALVSIHGGDWVCPLRVEDPMLGWIRHP